MHEVICSNLSQIEAEENVKILYACESGSRAWGFPSADSDYDVRFIYLRPLEWYLSLDEKRDVIELPIHDSLDINGWDLKKTLQLLRKSNPPLLEWLGSPIIYYENHPIISQLRQFIRAYYSPSICQRHFLSMARGNYREYLKGEAIWVKKYFYVLRPLLAMIWIEKDLGVIPTDFNVMLDRLITEPELHAAIRELIAKKRNNEELAHGPRSEPISQFIESELTRWETREIAHPQPSKTTNELDSFFRACLADVWQTA